MSIVIMKIIITVKLINLHKLENREKQKRFIQLKFSSYITLSTKKASIPLSLHIQGTTTQSTITKYLK